MKRKKPSELGRNGLDRRERRSGGEEGGVNDTEETQ
jgi:hypothetical protein